jgi:hypothetical protein
MAVRNGSHYRVLLALSLLWAALSRLAAATAGIATTAMPSAAAVLSPKGTVLWQLTVAAAVVSSAMVPQAAAAYNQLLAVAAAAAAAAGASL